jgi:hypothetical protein
LRANFITDSGAEYLFTRLVLVETPRIMVLFIRQNLWSEHAKVEIYRRLKSQVHVVSAEDDFEIIGAAKLTFTEEWKAPTVGPESLTVRE